LHSYTYQYVNELGVILKPVSPIFYFTYPSGRHPKLCVFLVKVQPVSDEKSDLHLCVSALLFVCQANRIDCLSPLIKSSSVQLTDSTHLILPTGLRVHITVYCMCFTSLPKWIHWHFYTA